MSDQPAGASSSFDLLDIRVRRWIWEKHWAELNDIQENSIPVLLAGRDDVIITAATGRGKTEAAFLPICSVIGAPAGAGGIGAIYISPLKALINDQFTRLESLCESLELPVHRWHGDVAASRKQAMLRRPQGILLITPESLEAFFVLRGPQVPVIFAGLKYVVVDELHSFIGSDRGAQLQSLIHRLELATRRRIPRVGLSATIGDISIAADFLRPGGGMGVTLVQSGASGQELMMQLRGYRKSAPSGDAGTGAGDGDTRSAEREITEHIFKSLRGTKNLVFANSRSRVEEYADRLRQKSEEMGLPQEFWPHHGNLSKSVREDVEGLLKEAGRPASAVCTSTLEMGIDIGEIASVAQIGTPPSVASLRQRLGRSGRRDAPAVLRTYVTELELGPQLAPQDAIRTRLVTNIAMLNLLIAHWCEPPDPGVTHLSTLVQQILSMIAQHGGVRPRECWSALCGQGPFGAVDGETFATILRSIAGHDLIVQAQDGTLLLGETGEKIVNHYSFYSAFESPDEFTIVAGAAVLGSLPVNYGIGPGSLLVFAGRRWRVTGVDDSAKRIAVEPAPGGVPPMFDGGEIGCVHSRVRHEMRRVFESVEIPVYLDKTARELLAEGRGAYRSLGLEAAQILRHGDDVHLFPWEGDRVHGALAQILRHRGFDASFDGVVVLVRGATVESVRAELQRAGSEPPIDPAKLTVTVENVAVSKHDRYLPVELLRAEFAAGHFDVEGAIVFAQRLGGA